MKFKLFFGALNIIALFSASAVTAQNFQQLPITSGFNADVIANGTASSSVSTNNDVDGVSYALVSRDFQLTASSTPLTYGLPVNGIINSAVAATPGLSYKLADYNSSNALRLWYPNDSGTLVFATPKPALKLYMLATSASYASTINITINFTDTTSQTFTGITISPWMNGSNFAIQGVGRIKRTNDALESGYGTFPSIYQIQLVPDTANQTKPIQSVTITKTSSTQAVATIYAFSADVYSDCAVPVLQPIGTVTTTSANVSWAVPAGTAAISHDIYYSTNNTAPNGSITPNLPGVTGTSTTIFGLSPSTIYYYWVRANCSSATNQSAWSFMGTFKTLCGPMTSMFENFDTYSPGSIVPDCWIRLVGGGSQQISSSLPASAPRNIYQSTNVSATPTYVVLPVFSNVNAGTNQLRFKARVAPDAGALIIGYVTDPSDASTFVVLQTLAINNTSYASNAEYIVPIPNTVPAGARLAIGTKDDGKSYYWDDMYWEANTLATSELGGNKKKLMIHPNPFKDVLYISDVEKVTSVTISDVSGRVVRTIENPSKEIDLNLLNSGLYLVTLHLKDGTQYTIKTIKK
ncbi:T9SS type A sorting domain-containing protein [Chryseobacterium wanjuense]